MSLSLGYEHQENKDVSRCRGNFELDYAKDKSFKADVSTTRPGKDEYILDVKLVTPSEKAKNINFKVNTKRSEEQKKVNSEVLATVDGKKYTLTSELVYLEASPRVKFVLQYPDGKEDKFIANIEIINRKKYNGNVKVIFVNYYITLFFFTARRKKVEGFFRLIMHLNL